MIWISDHSLKYYNDPVPGLLRVTDTANTRMNIFTSYILIIIAHINNVSVTEIVSTLFSCSCLINLYHIFSSSECKNMKIQQVAVFVCTGRV